MSKTTVGRAQRPAECLGEGDVARVVGGDVGAQLEGSAYDADFDRIAAATGQRCQWVVPAGTLE